MSVEQPHGAETTSGAVPPSSHHPNVGRTGGPRPPQHPGHDQEQDGAGGVRRDSGTASVRGLAIRQADRQALQRLVRRTSGCPVLVGAAA
jgi:hypothetical protein